MADFALVQDAMKAPRETVVYLPAIIPDGSRPDYLVTVDVDPTSTTFSQVNILTHAQLDTVGLEQSFYSGDGLFRLYTDCPCCMLETSCIIQVTLLLAAHKSFQAAYCQIPWLSPNGKHAPLCKVTAACFGFVQRHCWGLEHCNYKTAHPSSIAAMYSVRSDRLNFGVAPGAQ